MTTELSLIIDPAGIAGMRDGINLQVFPSGENPLIATDSEISLQRTANNSLLANSTRPVINFDTRFVLEQPDFNSLKGLYDYNMNASAGLNPFEIVIYNLVEPFSEIATARTRYRVPDTSNIEEIVGTYATKFTYWVALQGVFNMDWRQVGRLFEVNFSFKEGTKLTSSMEL